MATQYLAVKLGGFNTIFVNYQNSAVSGVVLDIYDLKTQNINSYGVGAGPQVLSTDTTGFAIGTLSVDFSSQNLYYRATWPVGSYDSTKPTYQHQEIGPVFPKEQGL